MRYTTTTLLAAIAVLSCFFHLRVFDEHKDYDEDCKHYPDRILQRGVVTLRDLRRLGILAICAEFVVAALAGWPAVAAVAIVLVYTLLMLREFFVGAWLRRHFLLYASSHMLVMPLLALVCFAFATGRPPWDAPAWFWLYAFVGYFVTFNWEVSRKIRAPQDEIEGVDSYTRVFGTYGAAWVVLGIRVIDTGMVALVGYHIGLGPWFYVALVALFILCLTGFVRYRMNTCTRTAKAMETYAGLYIIAFDLALALSLGEQFGLQFGSGS